MAGAWLQLFRVLIPSWRFFDRPESVPLMEIRFARVAQDYGPWRKRLARSPDDRRGIRNLFLNAEENHLLACQSLLQHLQHDFEHGTTDGVSSSLVENLALNSFPGDPTAVERITAAKIQYRVIFPNKQVYLSPEHDVSTAKPAVPPP